MNGNGTSSEWLNHNEPEIFFGGGWESQLNVNRHSAVDLSFRVYPAGKSRFLCEVQTVMTGKKEVNS